MQTQATVFPHNRKTGTGSSQYKPRASARKETCCNPQPGTTYRLPESYCNSLYCQCFSRFQRSYQKNGITHQQTKYLPNDQPAQNNVYFSKLIFVPFLHKYIISLQYNRNHPVAVLHQLIPDSVHTIPADNLTVPASSHFHQYR